MSGHSDAASSYQMGYYIAGGLAILSIVEFFAANVGDYVQGTGDAAMMLIAIIAMGKTALIAEFFMHFGSLFQSDDAGGH